MARKKSTTLIDKYLAQKRISRLWLISSFIIILMFVIFSITSRFGNKEEDAWQWLLQQLIPILTLIISTFVNSSQTEETEKKVKLFHFKIAFYLSLGYFLLLIITIFSMPFAAKYSQISGYDLLKKSSLYLLPFLGLVTAALGMFFSKDERNEGAQNGVEA